MASSSDVGLVNMSSAQTESLSQNFQDDDLMKRLKAEFLGIVPDGFSPEEQERRHDSHTASSNDESRPYRQESRRESANSFASLHTCCSSLAARTSVARMSQNIGGGSSPELFFEETEDGGQEETTSVKNIIAKFQRKSSQPSQVSPKRKSSWRGGEGMKRAGVVRPLSEVAAGAERGCSSTSLYFSPTRKKLFSKKLSNNSPHKKRVLSRKQSRENKENEEGCKTPPPTAMKPIPEEKFLVERGAAVRAVEQLSASGWSAQSSSKIFEPSAQSSGADENFVEDLNQALAKLPFLAAPAGELLRPGISERRGVLGEKTNNFLLGEKTSFGPAGRNLDHFLIAPDAAAFRDRSEPQDHSAHTTSAVAERANFEAERLADLSKRVHSSSSRGDEGGKKSPRGRELGGRSNSISKEKGDLDDRIRIPPPVADNLSESLRNISRESVKSLISNFNAKSPRNAAPPPLFGGAVVVPPSQLSGNVRSKGDRGRDTAQFLPTGDDDDAARRSASACSLFNSSKESPRPDRFATSSSSATSTRGKTENRKNTPPKTFPSGGGHWQNQNRSFQLPSSTRSPPPSSASGDRRPPNENQILVASPNDPVRRMQNMKKMTERNPADRALLEARLMRRGAGGGTRKATPLLGRTEVGTVV